MRRSTDRILTTHVGSLARPRPLLETMREKEHGRPHDRDLFHRQVSEAVVETVRRQHEAGIDVVNDGEQGRASFFTYVVERLDGFSALDAEPLMPPSWRREIDAYPEFYDRYFEKYVDTVVPLQTVTCIGPVSYRGHDAIATDIANLRAAIDAVNARVGDGGGVTEAFISATSPRGFGRNAYYASEAEYLRAVAEALREEYLAIVEAGFLLQIDDPWLIEIMTGAPGSRAEKRLRTANEHVEILNHALSDIPIEKIRLHTCYGLNAGPRTHDLALAEIGPMMLKVRAGGYSFEVANPRHSHEWKIWTADRLGPLLGDDQVLIPGFLGHATPYVEHPELIADGICNYASLVGRERVIAGADCGFSSRASFAPEIPDVVVWEKFKALAEGARIATERLWG